MSPIPGISLVAFDMFGTLVRNEARQWMNTLHDIALAQELPLTGEQFWEVWRKYEVNFRRTRTNMGNPEASPAFRTYWEGWRDAFAETFAVLGLEGDAELAATRCVDALAKRDAFPDVAPTLRDLDGRYRLSVMSNADDRFLLGAIEHNGWRFDTVVSSEQARAYKPDPRAFMALCEVAQVPPEAVLYVGDSVYDDMHGARLAGMRAVLVRRNQTTPGRTPPPDTQELLPPDHTVESLDGLVALLA